MRSLRSADGYRDDRARAMEAVSEFQLPEQREGRGREGLEVEIRRERLFEGGEGEIDHAEVVEIGEDHHAEIDQGCRVGQTDRGERMGRLVECTGLSAFLPGCRFADEAPDDKRLGIRIAEHSVGVYVERLSMVTLLA